MIPNRCFYFPMNIITFIYIYIYSCGVSAMEVFKHNEFEHSTMQNNQLFTKTLQPWNNSTTNSPN